MLRDDWREPLRAQRDPVARGSGRVRSNRDSSRWRKQTWLGRFVSTYGWRAYALPVLVALTVVVVYQTTTGTSAPRRPLGSGARPAENRCGGHGDHRRAARGSYPIRCQSAHRDAAERWAVHRSRGKTWHIVPGRRPTVGQGTAKVFKYTVEIENGIDPSTFGGDDAFAAMVDQTLANPKSWMHNSQFAFTRIDRADMGKPDFRNLAEFPDDGAGGLWLRIPAGDVLL